MSTMVGKIKVLQDTRLRVNGATTVNGAAQNKGTATDLLLVIGADADGTASVAGTTNVVLQGSNSSAFGTPTAVTPDKGSFAAVTAAGSQSVHAAQLQFQFYRVVASNTAASTAAVSASWLFMPVEDSFDATVQ